MENRIFDAIIIGAGPAGIFTALELTHLKPESQVLIVDMGRAIAHRACPARTTGKCVHCDPCGIVHGWAGAGRSAHTCPWYGPGRCDGQWHGPCPR